MERRKIKLRKGETIDVEIVGDDGEAYLLERAHVIVMDVAGDNPGVRIQGSKRAARVVVGLDDSEEAAEEDDDEDLDDEDDEPETIPEPGWKTEWSGTGSGAAARAAEAAARVNRTFQEEDIRRAAQDRAFRDAQRADRDAAAAQAAVAQARAFRDEEARRMEAAYKAARDAAARAAERMPIDEFFRTVIGVDFAYKSGPDKRSPFGRPVGGPYGPNPGNPGAYSKPEPGPFESVRQEQYRSHQEKSQRQEWKSEYQGRPDARPLPTTWRSTLGFPEAGPPPNIDQVRIAYRDRMKTAHPDQGGSHESAVALNRAWDAARRSLGIKR